MNRKKWIWILSFVLAGWAAHAAAEEHGAVVLQDELQFLIKSRDKAIFKRHVRVQINNESGQTYGYVFVHESPFVDVRKIKACILDEAGERIRKIKKDEIEEYASNPDFVQYSENKVHAIRMQYGIFPYQIDIEYEQEFKSLFFWPDWKPQQDIPVNQCSYYCEIPKHIPYRFKSIGGIPPCEEQKQGNKKIVFWQVDSLEKRPDIYRLPPENRLHTGLLFAPQTFRLKNYRGSLESWQLFGKWYEELTSDRYDLSPEIETEIRMLVAHCVNDREKIKILYRHLQQYTRYVAIYLGIDGYQPHHAELTYRNRYGDCKDLSTLMIAMLRVAGLKGFPVLIGTEGEMGHLDPEFPLDLFNHVIVGVPCKSDTMWLECTSDVLPAGQLPWTVADIHALWIDESGGRLIRTPESSVEENQWISSVQGRLTGAGRLDFTAQIDVQGQRGYGIRNRLKDEKIEDRSIWLKKQLGRPDDNTQLDTFRLSNLAVDLDQPVLIHCEGRQDGFAKRSASRLFLRPWHIHYLTSGGIPDEEVRDYPLAYNYPAATIDSMTIELPMHFVFETQPEPVFMNTDFARYRMDYQLKGKQLQLVREYIIKKKRIPADQYEAYVDFKKKAVKADQAQFVLKKE